MPDISMCKGDNCPKKENCYRYTAPVNEYRQSYFLDTPIKEDGTCEHYWEVNLRGSTGPFVVPKEVD